LWRQPELSFPVSEPAAKAYYEERWTLCAPRFATMLDRPVGQWLSNLRRPGAPTTDPIKDRSGHGGHPAAEGVGGRHGA
jgi:hypothetical protein